MLASSNLVSGDAVHVPEAYIRGISLIPRPLTNSTAVVGFYCMCHVVRGCHIEEHQVAADHELWGQDLPIVESLPGSSLKYQAHHRMDAPVSGYELHRGGGEPRVMTVMVTNWGRVHPRLSQRRGHGRGQSVEGGKG